jgi:hypothetical protein
MFSRALQSRVRRRFGSVLGVEAVVKNSSVSHTELHLWE